MAIAVLRNEIVPSPRRFGTMPNMLYNIRMNSEYSHMRIWRTTLDKLRMIYALTGESMIAVVERLAQEELERLERQRDEAKAQKDA